MTPHWVHHLIPRIVWILTYALWIVPEIILSIRLRTPDGAQKLDRGSKSVVILFVNLAVACGWMACAVFPSFALGAHWEQMFTLGIAVWIAGIAIRLYSIYVLRQFFTYDVAIRKGQQVVQAGPYRWVRHPSYAGGMLAMLGFGLTMTNWIAAVLPLAVVAIGYAYRIPLEERALTAGLGEDYRSYMTRTWRLVPFLF